jgi:hypothetical protein
MVNVFTTVDVSPTTKIFIRKKDKNTMKKRFSVSNAIVKNKRKLKRC